MGPVRAPPFAPALMHGQPRSARRGVIGAPKPLRLASVASFPTFLPWLPTAGVGTGSTAPCGLPNLYTRSEKPSPGRRGSLGQKRPRLPRGESSHLQPFSSAFPICTRGPFRLERLGPPVLGSWDPGGLGSWEPGPLGPWDPGGLSCLRPAVASSARRSVSLSPARSPSSSGTG